MKCRNIILGIFLSIACCYSFDLSIVTKQYFNDEFPSVIKEFAPASHVCQIDSDITFEVQGFLYITKKLCGIESNIAINCPNVQYSVRLGIINESKDNPFSLYEFYYNGNDSYKLTNNRCEIVGSEPFLQIPNELAFYGLGMFLRTNQYPKLKHIHQHIEKELENKAYIIIPVHLKINNVVFGRLYSAPYNIGLLDIKEILPLSEQEKQNILKHKCKINRDYIDINDINYCRGDISDDKIYPFSKDLYVNMRKEPNMQSRVIARLASVAPKGEEYMKLENEELLLSDGHFPVFGFLSPISIYEEEYANIDDANTMPWLVNRARFIRNNPDVKIVKAQTIYALKNYGFADNEQVELYTTKSLPVNGWYEVYFIDKTGKKIEGYIHKSQLSWGF